MNRLLSANDITFLTFWLQSYSSELRATDNFTGYTLLHKIYITHLSSCSLEILRKPREFKDFMEKMVVGVKFMRKSAGKDSRGIKVINYDHVWDYVIRVTNSLHPELECIVQAARNRSDSLHRQHTLPLEIAKRELINVIRESHKKQKLENAKQKSHKKKKQKNRQH